MEIVRKIEAGKTGRNDKPEAEAKIAASGELEVAEPFTVSLTDATE